MDSPRVPLLFSSYNVLLPTHFLTILGLLALISTLFHNLGDACPTNCIGIPLKYPFGITDGCGDPNYKLICNPQSNMLQLNLGSYTYQILYIDYDEQIILLKDFSDSSSCTYLRDSSFSSSSYALNKDQFIICISSGSHLCNVSGLVNNVSSCALDIFYNYCNTADPSSECCANFESMNSSLPGCGVYGRASNIETLMSGLQSVSGLLPALGVLELKYATSPNQADCDNCTRSSGSCGYNSCGKFLCLGVSTNSSTQCSDSKTRNKTSLIIGLSVGGAVVILCLVGIFLLFLKRRRKTNNRDAIGFYPSSEQDKVLTKKLNSGETTLFSYRELEIATDYFSETRLLGGGGFSSVYKGILGDGQIVAVKKLNEWNKQGMNQFHNEVTILSKVRHPNLVQLHGSCIEGRGLLLVYEFVPNGTLADHLHGSGGKGLSWATRLRVVVETARALAYLHESVCPPIFHRDVKATNILLDASFHTKVGDFGLSRLVPMEVTHISTAPQGTPGYLDPDYYESYQLTDKSDVYSFGVLLMEIISAKKAVDMSREKREINLASLAISKIQSGALDELIDPNLEIQSKPVVKRMVTSVAELAFCCLSQEKDDRPCMKEVAEKLEQILQQGYGPSYISPQEDLMRATDNSETHLLIKTDPKSPTSVIETKWPSSTDSSNNSKGEF